MFDHSPEGPSELTGSCTLTVKVCCPERIKITRPLKIFKRIKRPNVKASGWTESSKVSNTDLPLVLSPGDSITFPALKCDTISQASLV
jgi:hypothetical protein